MISGKKNGLLDIGGLTFGMSISISTEAGHKAVSLVAMLRKKV